MMGTYAPSRLMPLSVKVPKTGRLARGLAKRAGETMAGAMRPALERRDDFAATGVTPAYTVTAPCMENIVR